MNFFIKVSDTLSGDFYHLYMEKVFPDSRENGSFRKPLNGGGYLTACCSSVRIIV